MDLKKIFLLFFFFTREYWEFSSAIVYLKCHQISIEGNFLFNILAMSKFGPTKKNVYKLHMIPMNLFEGLKNVTCKEKTCALFSDLPHALLMFKS